MFKNKFPSGFETLSSLSAILNSNKTEKFVVIQLKKHTSDFEHARMILTNVATTAMTQTMNVLVNENVIENLTNLGSYFRERIGELQEAENLFLILQALVSHLTIILEKSKKYNVVAMQ